MKFPAMAVQKTTPHFFPLLLGLWLPRISTYSFSLCVRYASAGFFFFFVGRGLDFNESCNEDEFNRLRFGCDVKESCYRIALNFLGLKLMAGCKLELCIMDHVRSGFKFIGGKCQRVWNPRRWNSGILSLHLTWYLNSSQGMEWEKIIFFAPKILALYFGIHSFAML